MKKIKFGTDGWRGVISKDFTFENLFKVAFAHALVLKEDGAKRVLVGYDLRFLSEEYAKLVARVFSENGLEAVLTKFPSPTPAVSYAVKELGFDCGVVITASHNHSKYNGYKVKESFGGPARTSYTNRIEDKIESAPEFYEVSADFETEDINPVYIEGVRKVLDESVFKEKEVLVVHDAMYGVQQGFVQKVLEGTKITIMQFRSYRDTLFGGIHPEPVVERNVKPLCNKVRSLKAWLGIAHDGDGDRVGIVDEKGNFINSQISFALVLLHLIRNRKLVNSGIVVKTVSSGFLVDRICRKEGLELKEVPVGFKNISELVVKENVVFGGEESGGYAYINHVPERDGLLMGLLILEKSLMEEKPVSVLVEELFKEFGSAYYVRKDLPVSEEEKRILEDVKKSPPDRWNELKVKKVLTIDGLKLIFEDDSWILFRPSGTEPLFRIYAETPSKEKTLKLIEWGCGIFKR